MLLPALGWAAGPRTPYEALRMVRGQKARTGNPGRINPLTKKPTANTHYRKLKRAEIRTLIDGTTNPTGKVIERSKQKQPNNVQPQRKIKERGGWLRRAFSSFWGLF